MWLACSVIQKRVEPLAWALADGVCVIQALGGCASVEPEVVLVHVVHGHGCDFATEDEEASTQHVGMTSRRSPRPVPLPLLVMEARLTEWLI